jgi:hypothetical protein
LNDTEGFITAIGSRTFLTMSQAGMQPNLTIPGTDGKSLFIKVPMNIRVCTKFLNDLLTIIFTYQLLEILKRNGIPLQSEEFT